MSRILLAGSKLVDSAARWLIGNGYFQEKSEIARGGFSGKEELCRPGQNTYLPANSGQMSEMQQIRQLHSARDITYWLTLA